MPKWYVIGSPVYSKLDNVWSYEPPDVGRDLALIYAQTRKQAKWAALKLWEQRYPNNNWCDDNRRGGHHPLSSLEILEEHEKLSHEELEAWDDLIGIAVARQEAK